MKSTGIRNTSHYLGSEKYASLIYADGKGGSYSGQTGLGFFINSQTEESGVGKCIYIRDNLSGDFWTNTASPICNNDNSINSKFQQHSHHSEINTEYNQIETRTSILVPFNQDFEVWHFQLTNKSTQLRNLSLFSFVEYDQKGSDLDTIIWGEHLGINSDSNTSNYIYKRVFTNHKSSANQQKDVSIYHAFTGGELVGFETNLDSFIGKGRSYSNPIVVENGKCSNQYKSIIDRCSVMQIDVSLKQEETKDFFMFIGVESGDQKPEEIITELGNSKAITRELETLQNNKTYITNAVRII